MNLDTIPPAMVSVALSQAEELKPHYPPNKYQQARDAFLQGVLDGVLDARKVFEGERSGTQQAVSAIKSAGTKPDLKSAYLAGQFFVAWNSQPLFDEFRRQRMAQTVEDQIKRAKLAMSTSPVPQTSVCATDKTPTGNPEESTPKTAKTERSL